MTIILVTGDRNWDDRELLFATLDGYRDCSEIIEGCARGADRMAEEWALGRYVDLHHFPADWIRKHRGAGPQRNKEMLRHQPAPDLVIAFHNDLANSKGTANMVALAERAGVPVVRIGQGGSDDKS